MLKVVDIRHVTLATGAACEALLHFLDAELID